MQSRTKQAMRLFWHSWGWPVIVAVLLTTSFKSAIADWNVVPTGSMIPTIVEGDRILVNKLAYDLKLPYTTYRLANWEDPQRGDIVVFFSPKDGQRLVKRVVGLPGDFVAMYNNRLFINGQRVWYDVITDPGPGWGPQVWEEDLMGKSHPIQVDSGRSSTHTFNPLEVPQNHYFMLGDNRDNSADSRYFGSVQRKLILGRATAVVMSLDVDNHYQPRWRRFFSKLK